ncbi:protein SAD1/UNC-84 domain protein 1-like [Ananas comosus]|uniref:Protein SAD1/UNC-84 domain protein 1-like n=1 Tax=Ananas comosus TaxID=4615 RepID=A0A6P5G4S9_ANACO|nr:protein SAD1/UNC-84 domain protein 1-like [Ananas comosus]XP_020103304.1 protein SAD1/UNC-84 domain protein 1-like [Ananas comosus]XP_020103305.1 protein SAD1/UNC-84 domain protein 1-like [Ananas comosus]
MSASKTAAVPTTPVTNKNTSLTLDSGSNPNARRRTVVVLEKKSNAGILAEGAANGVVEDKMVVIGKDLRHTIRGETVIGAQKDSFQSKKGTIAPSATSPRQKKVGHRPEKPKWQTVLSVMTKNCLLVAALLWLGQTIWDWNNRVREPGDPSFAALEYEGRISEVESSLKTTAKMLQVQIEVVDKRIGKEIGALKQEFGEQVEEKRALLEKDLKKLEGRADNLEKSLSELKIKDFVSREEFEDFWNEVEISGSLDGSTSEVSLDQIRVLAREIVEKEIEKHAADGLGRVDYALASGGARVVRHSEPYGFSKASSWIAAAKARSGVHATAHKMLEPSFGEPGQCFALQGSSGFIEIRLRTGIIPEAVTLEHVSKGVAYDRSSAPKDCRVSGWFETPDEDPSTRAAKTVVLSEFSYDLEKSYAQTFNIQGTEAGIVNTVRFDFTSNHGSSALTCIYRFRVHGREPSPRAGMALQA